MKISCGTDIIEIERVKKAIENTGERFLENVFTEAEIAYCEARKMQKYQHYAARFAAKEAAFKALNPKMKCPHNWKNFEVEKDENGRPVLKINGEIEGVEGVDLSLSHCREYAVANVVAILE